MNLEYTIKRVPRAKQIKIVVRNGKVIVTAPKGVPVFIISTFVKAQRAWIEKTQEQMIKNREAWVAPEHVVQESFATCKERARKMVRDKVEHFNVQYQYTYKRISVKNMTTRWGSCSTKKNLNFHYRLLFLPAELSDYIVVHELCHLQEMNHSKAFWKLVARTIPDHASRRRALKKYRLT